MGGDPYRQRHYFLWGADLRDSSGSTGDFKGTFWEKPTINSFESGKEIYKPVIAAVNGACVGYGLTAVTFCDFVIASDNATFSYPEVTIGIPTIVGAIRLPKKLIGQMQWNFCFLESRLQQKELMKWVLFGKLLS